MKLKNINPRISGIDVYNCLYGNIYNKLTRNNLIIHKYLTSSVWFKIDKAADFFFVQELIPEIRNIYEA